MRSITRIMAIMLLGLMAFGCSQEEVSQGMEDAAGAVDSAARNG